MIELNKKELISINGGMEKSKLSADSSSGFDISYGVVTGVRFFFDGMREFVNGARSGSKISYK